MLSLEHLDDIFDSPKNLSCEQEVGSSYCKVCKFHYSDVPVSTSIRCLKQQIKEWAEYHDYKHRLYAKK